MQFCLSMKVLAWNVEPNGIKNKNIIKYLYPIGINKCDVPIIYFRVWYREKTIPDQQHWLIAHYYNIQKGEVNGGHQDEGAASLVVRDSFNFVQVAQLVHFLSLQEQLHEGP